MKKLIITGLTILTIFSLILLVDSISVNSIDKENISVNELKKEIENNSDVIVYFYQTDCIYCKEASPIISKIEKELDLNITRLDLQKERKGWEEFQITMTPTLVFYKDAQEINRLEALQSEDRYLDWFTEIR